MPFLDLGAIQQSRDIGAVFAASGPSAALSGTIIGSDEAGIVTGGKTIILTLTGDTWAAAGTGPIGSLADTQAIIDGIDSAQAEAAGWDAVVKTALDPATDVVRTSDTVCTITLPAFTSYNITAQETITATIPAAALVTSADPVVATPTFNVSPVTVSITSGPASVARGGTGIIIGISGGSAAQGTATVTYGGQPCMITSYPAGGTGNVLVTIPSTITLQHNATGYTFVYTDDSTDSDTSGVVPFNEPTGWDYTDITETPSLVQGSIFYGFTGEPAPAIGGQAVFESTMSPDNIPFTVGPDGELIWDTDPTRNQTASIYYIAADGTLTDVGIFTWSVAGGPVTVRYNSGLSLKSFGRLGVR